MTVSCYLADVKEKIRRWLCEQVCCVCHDPFPACRSSVPVLGDMVASAHVRLYRLRWTRSIDLNWLISYWIVILDGLNFRVPGMVDYTRYPNFCRSHGRYLKRSVNNQKRILFFRRSWTRILSQYDNTSLERPMIDHIYWWMACPLHSLHLRTCRSQLHPS